MQQATAPLECRCVVLVAVALALAALSCAPTVEQASQQLFTAIEQEDWDAAQRAFEAGANANATTTEGITPLHVAVLHGNERVVRLLLAKGADPDSRIVNGKTPLIGAASEGDARMVTLLLASGASPSLADVEGYTPLHFAALHANPEVAALLLDAGASVNARTVDGYTPFFVAYFVGLDTDYPTAKRERAKATSTILLKHGAAVTSFQLCAALVNDDASGLRKLLHWGGNPDTLFDLSETPQYRATLLHTAVNRAKPEIVKVLLEAGAAVDAKDSYGNTPLMIAHWAILDVPADFEEGNLRPKLADYTQWEPGLRIRILEVHRLLLINGADPNARNNRGYPVMWDALEYGATDIALLLLEHGANPNLAVIPSLGTTPLAFICDDGDLELGKALLAHGADPNIQSTNGFTPLHCTSGKGRLDWVKMLMEHGAQANVVTDEGKTPLFMAASSGHGMVVRYLLAHGADVNSRDHYGYTPLHYAAGKGDLTSVFSLLEAGARQDRRNEDLLSPLDLATREGHSRVVKILKEYSPPPGPKPPPRRSSSLDRQLKSVVVISTPTGHGSGVILSRDGLVVSNEHVVESQDFVFVRLPGGSDQLGKVVRRDPKRDLVLIKIRASDYSAARMGDTPPIGEKVYAIGAPRGLEASVTGGIVSAIREFGGVKYVQTDAPISPGNSGGPLIHSATGSVIGINTVKITGEGIEGLGFAVAAEEVERAFGKELRAVQP